MLRFCRGEGEGSGAENTTEDGVRIIVGNSFHFIKSWSPRRHRAAVMRGVREERGNTSEGLIAGGILLLGCELREKG